MITMTVLKQIDGYSVIDYGYKHLIVDGKNAEPGQSPDIAIGYAIGVLHDRYPGSDQHEVRFKNYPETDDIYVGVFSGAWLKPDK